MRARFLYLGAEHWRDAFSPLLYQSHYPLLIPCSIARSWCFVGEQTVVVPIIVASLFTFATIGLLYSTLAILRNTHQATLAVLVFLSIPAFIEVGAYLQADAPLAFFFLASIALLGLYDQDEARSRGILFLAGLMAGLAIWTKREGSLVLISLVAARCLSVFYTQGWKQCGRQMLVFAAGVCPVMFVYLYFRVLISQPDDFLAAQSFQSITGGLLDVTRHFTIMRGFVKQALVLGGWIGIPGLLVALLILGWPPSFLPKLKPVLLTVAIVIMLMLAIDWLVYTVTPYPFHWHLKTSLSRFLLHLWPSFVFGFFLLSREMAGVKRGTDGQTTSQMHW